MSENATDRLRRRAAESFGMTNPNSETTQDQGSEGRYGEAQRLIRELRAAESDDAIDRAVDAVEAFVVPLAASVPGGPVAWIEDWGLQELRAGRSTEVFPSVDEVEAGRAAPLYASIELGVGERERLMAMLEQEIQSGEQSDYADTHESHVPIADMRGLLALLRVTPFALRDGARLDYLQKQNACEVNRMGTSVEYWTVQPQNLKYTGVGDTLRDAIDKSMEAEARLHGKED